MPPTIAALDRIHTEIEYELLLLAIFEPSPLAHILQPTIMLNFHVVAHRNDKDTDLGDCKDEYLFAQKHLNAPRIPDSVRYTVAVRLVSEAAFQFYSPNEK
jgi:hypothetical protein